MLECMCGFTFEHTHNANVKSITITLKCDNIVIYIYKFILLLVATILRIFFGRVDLQIWPSKAFFWLHPELKFN